MKKVFNDALAVLVEMGVDAFEVGGRLVISGESDHSDKFYIDYHAFSWGEFGVDPVVVNALEAFGLNCEWHDPGTLHVYEE